jgi:hypothetical protein
MGKVGLALLVLLGIYLYLDGTGATMAAAVLTGAAMFYVLLTAFLMRD